MHAIEMLRVTLEAAGLLAWLAVALGVLGVVRWWLRQPVSSQSEREAMFLARQMALHHPIRGSDPLAVLRAARAAA